MSETPRPALLDRLKAPLVRVLQLHDTPESIARGAALGVFIGLTPTWGIHVIAVLVVNTAFKANRLAGLVTMNVVNPFTLLWIYWAEWYLGTVLLGRSPKEGWTKILGLKTFQTHGVLDRLGEFGHKLWGMGMEILGPLFLGGFLLAAVAAVPTYYLTLALVRRHRRRMADPDKSGTDKSGTQY